MRFLFLLCNLFNHLDFFYKYRTTKYTKMQNSEYRKKLQIPQSSIPNLNSVSHFLTALKQNYMNYYNLAKNYTRAKPHVLLLPSFSRLYLQTKGDVRDPGKRCNEAPSRRALTRRSRMSAVTQKPARKTHFDSNL